MTPVRGLTGLTPRLKRARHPTSSNNTGFKPFKLQVLHPTRQVDGGYPRYELRQLYEDIPSIADVGSQGH